MSSILHECKSWIWGDLKPMMKLYNCCLKVLLGVRKSTCNDVCCVESGYLPVQDLACYKKKKHYFVHASWWERIHRYDDPLHFVLDLVELSTTSTGRIVTRYVTNDVIPWKDLTIDVVNWVRYSLSSIRVTSLLTRICQSTMYLYRETYHEWNAWIIIY